LAGHGPGKEHHSLFNGGLSKVKAEVTSEIKRHVHSSLLKPLDMGAYIWMQVTYFRQVVCLGLSPGKGIKTPCLCPHQPVKWSSEFYYTDPIFKYT